MDEIMLHFSEVESDIQDLEKQTGKLTVQMDKTASDTENALKLLKELQEQQESMLAEIRMMQRHMDSLTSRIDQLDETADLVEEHYQTLNKQLWELSRDVDGIYEDMNVLSSETKKRGVKLQEQMERFLWENAGYIEDEEEEGE
ncbi:MAG: hypothetical protein MJ071_01045 [Oscillospiraceae bacterium]|nr:hypothetical protein [Oscillospiraceae bacterium]